MQEIKNHAPAESETQNISISFKRDINFLSESVAEALKFCSSFKAISLWKDALQAVEITLTEGLSNAIKQAPVFLPEGMEDKITFEIKINDSCLEILIYDFGKGFKIDEISEPDFNAHPESGYGIYIIKMFMDQVSYTGDTKPNVLRIKKLLSKNERKGIQILIVDDDKQLRILLMIHLKKQGHTVFEAENAEIAFDILKKHRIQLVISDWMMPGEDGISFCKRIREYNFNYYIYFILLTSRDSQSDIITGLEAGADDFIAKPFDKQELLVRIRAGERVINLERDLAEKNKNLREASHKIEEAYLRIRQDLESAARFQSKLLPEKKNHLIDRLNFDWIFLPSDFVAGDLFNFFQINEEYAAFYVFDVSGHGVASAMLSFTLHRELFPNKNTSGLIYTLNPGGEIQKVHRPHQIISKLNQQHYTESSDLQFFTIFYALYNMQEKKLTFVQGGHPPAILIKKNGTHSLLSSNGPAIGIFKDVKFEEKTIDMEKGDRLYIYSDGVTECANRNNEEFSEERLQEILKKNRHFNLKEILYTLKMDLIEWSDGRSFADDITLLGIEF